MSATLLAQFGESLSRQLEAKCKTQGTSSHNTQPTQAQAVPCADEPQSCTIAADGIETASDSRDRTMLERIQSVTGPLRAYDARYCVWGSNGPFDIRDIARRLGVHHMDVVDALPEFKPVRRGKRGDDDNSSDSAES